MTRFQFKLFFNNLKEKIMKKCFMVFVMLSMLAVLAFANVTPSVKGSIEAYQDWKANGGNQAVRSGQSGVDTPGDQLAVIYAPVTNWLGVSVAADCRGDLYYTNYQIATLYKMTATGTLISSVPIVDPSGMSVTLGEMSWDESRQMLWAASDDNPVHGIYLLDPTTGIATFQFVGMGGYDLTDGLAYDPTDGTIWHSTDISSDIAHFSATGTLLGTLTPLDAFGNPQGSISGVLVGTGNTLYVGHDGLGVITRIDKTTGAFISTFAVPGGRDEGMECDAINFAPNLAVWVKGAYDNSFTAFEVDAGTCACSQLPDTCQLEYQQVDMGDLAACNYPTLVGNPAHALTGVAWLGVGITGEPVPNTLNLDPADDGVIYHNLPWTPCSVESVTVIVTAGPMYPYYEDLCRGHLYLNGWKDGNLDGDFCDTLCYTPGAAPATEWIVQDVLVTPGMYTFSFIDPGVTDMGIYDGVFRWRLTSQPVGRFGFGMADPAVCNMSCGTYAFDIVGEVEDYILPRGQLPVEMTSFNAVAGDGNITLHWTTASETNNNHFVLYKRVHGYNGFSAVTQIPGNGTTTTEHSYNFVDNSVVNGVTYEYRISDVDINGVENIHDQIVFATPSYTASAPTEYSLYQNYPNPFNPTTTIRFDILNAGKVSLKVYDITGREVVALVNNELSAGAHSVTFDASGLASGVYLYRLQAGDFTATKKLLFLK
jgi:hypothetical protein